MAEVEKDADTGDEIIYFIRRGREYLFLRDMVTKRFIRKLETVEKRYFMVVEYSKERARKQNPLYIDAAIFTQLTPSEFPKRHEINDEMEKALRSQITIRFGSAVADILLEAVGYEIGSRPEYDAKYQDRKAAYIVVWKHYELARPKKHEGEIRL